MSLKRSSQLLTALRLRLRFSPDSRSRRIQNAQSRARRTDSDALGEMRVYADRVFACCGPVLLVL